MANNYPKFKFDKNVALETIYIHIIGKWLMYSRENRTCINPSNSKQNLDRMLNDFFIEPKFELYKAQALYNAFTGILKKPFMDWKIADEEWFTQLDKYYKQLLINSKLQQIEGDFTND